MSKRRNIEIERKNKRLQDHLSLRKLHGERDPTATILPEHLALVMFVHQPRHRPFKLVLSAAHGAPHTSPKVHPGQCREIGPECRRNKERKKNKKFIHYKTIINSSNQLENNLYKTYNSNYYTFQPFQDHFFNKVHIDINNNGTKQHYKMDNTYILI